jgi:hypothetical protein
VRAFTIWSWRCQAPLELNEPRLKNCGPCALSHVPAIEAAYQDGTYRKVEHGARTEGRDQLAETLKVAACEPACSTHQQFDAEPILGCATTFDTAG